MESGFNGINSTFVLSYAGERLVGVSSSAVQNIKRSFHADIFVTDSQIGNLIMRYT